ncbi:hypothetical protein DERP_009048 [Dermatophagoides pteronyssinus]|uniref:Uncharacterized protein n=1 Tax=Dermatophagoides pteronyssinus TaxID=6956 RepID=A0ABQ8JGB6_DERPT|nr:hypothetical protein DERP_009048 [Dermatophagoides pteronyssinus]
MTNNMNNVVAVLHEVSNINKSTDKNKHHKEKSFDIHSKMFIQHSRSINSYRSLLIAIRSTANQIERRR